MRGARRLAFVGAVVVHRATGHARLPLEPDSHTSAIMAFDPASGTLIDPASPEVSRIEPPRPPEAKSRGLDGR